MGKLLLLLAAFVVVAVVVSVQMDKRSESDEESIGGARNVPVAAEGPSLEKVEPELLKAAQTSGVRLDDVSLDGRDATVRISWTGQNAALGGDFLNALLEAGVIADFDSLEGSAAAGTGPGGVRVWKQGYVLRLAP